MTDHANNVLISLFFLQTFNETFSLLTLLSYSYILLSNIFLILQELLSMDSNSQARSNYIQEMKNVAYQQLTLITSMETLKKDSDDMDALTLLVIGTYVRAVLPLTVYRGCYHSILLAFHNLSAILMTILLFVS